jgi:enoyl-CoA hydratase
MKRLAREGLEVSLSEGLEMEKQIAVPVLRSDNVAEGLAAFRERREPVFR